MPERGGGHLLGGRLAGVGAAALDDEAGHVAVELQAVVEALLGQLHEVADVDGGVVARNCTRMGPLEVLMTAISSPVG